MDITYYFNTIQITQSSVVDCYTVIAMVRENLDIYLKPVMEVKFLRTHPRTDKNESKRRWYCGMFFAVGV